MSDHTSESERRDTIESLQATRAGLETVPDEKVDHMPTIPQLIVALSILVLAMSSSLISRYLIPPLVPQSAPAAEARAPRLPPAQPFTDPFQTVSVKAESAYVWDVAKQRALFKKNASSQLPLASLTKLMTALVADELIDTKTATIPITLDAIKQEGENGFQDGETWSARDLLDYMLVSSSNDGAYALAAAAGATEENANPAEAFIEAMNKKAELLGLSQTYFTNPTGLDANLSQSGSYGSARDMAFLMEYIVRERPDLLSKTSEPRLEFMNEQGARYIATNTNQAVRAYPNLLGSKTGYTDLAGGNLVIAFDAGLNRPIIISVLHSTAEGRFSDVAALAEAAQAYVSAEPETP